MNIEEEITDIKKDTGHIKKMLEDLILTIRPKNKDTSIESIMGILKETILANDGIGKRPDVQELLNKMYDSVSGR